MGYSDGAVVDSLSKLQSIFSGKLLQQSVSLVQRGYFTEALTWISQASQDDFHQFYTIFKG